MGVTQKQLIKCPISATVPARERCQSMHSLLELVFAHILAAVERIVLVAISVISCLVIVIAN